MLFDIIALCLSYFSLPLDTLKTNSAKASISFNRAFLGSPVNWGLLRSILTFKGSFVLGSNSGTTRRFLQLNNTNG